MTEEKSDSQNNNPKIDINLQNWLRMLKKEEVSRRQEQKSGQGQKNEKDMLKLKLFKEQHPHIYSALEKLYNQNQLMKIEMKELEEKIKRYEKKLEDYEKLKKEKEELEAKYFDLETAYTENVNYKEEIAAWEQECRELKEKNEKLQQRYDNLLQWLKDNGYIIEQKIEEKIE